MKRDMDLIRLILLRVEQAGTPEATDLPTNAEVLYHSALAIEAGLLTGEVLRSAKGDVVSARLQRLTWAGHEFLDAARDATVWNQAKKKAREKGLEWTFEALRAYLLAFYQEKMNGRG